jgi:hypothetical protein
VIEDPIVAGVRRAREELAARYSHDVRAIARALRKEQAASGRKVVCLQPKRLPTVTPRRVRKQAGHRGAVSV